MELEKYVTPDWLENHGFGLLGEYEFKDETPSSDWPDPVFRNEFSHSPHLVYREFDAHRQVFWVILYPCKYQGGDVFYRHEVWVRYNVGCGSTEIPDQHTELDINRFKALYFAITGNQLKETK